MNEDQMISLLSRLDDDQLAKEVDKLMAGVDFDEESIKRKAIQKLSGYSRKVKRRRNLSYAAAVCACFVCLNVAYADEISETIKSFFDKRPVYTTMVDGKAYYLPQSLKLNDKTTITSLMVSDDRMEMELTSDLSPELLYQMKMIPQNDPDTEYGIGVYAKNGDKKYSLDFANVKEKKFKFKPSKDFSLLLEGQTYAIHLEEAKPLNQTQQLSASRPGSNKIDLVTVGANSIEQNGKREVQLIAAFKETGLKLIGFGEQLEKTNMFEVENLGKDGIISSSTSPSMADIYAYDEKGIAYKLERPQDANTMPVTTFKAEASKEINLTVYVPALQACYENAVVSFPVNIPETKTENLNREVDLVAQKAIIKSVERISPSSAKMVMQLNTGAQEYVKIKSFMIYSEDVKKIEAEFSGDKCVLMIELKEGVNEADFEVSWPRFEMIGNWSINLR